MARRRKSLTVLIAIVVLIAGASAYFLGINPIWSHINEGLDLKGGLNVVYQAVPSPNEPVTQAAMSRTLDVMRYRIDSLGVTEPYIQQEGSNQIVIQLPGITNPDQAIQVIGKTGLLQFKDSKGNIIVTGSDLRSAQAQIDASQQNQPDVQLQFDSAGAQKIAAFTTKNVGKLMPIYLDGKMIENPTIQNPITNGSGIITGFSTLQAAKQIAIELNSGALPLKLNLIENQSISATLGAESINRSLQAAALAAVLVVAFMLTLYRIPGLWADLALAVYSMVLLGGLYLIHATLTLPGITGIILSIGMAVDANIIIFERTREELRAGRTLRSAVDAGFHHGLRAVIDGHVTALIACAVLYWLGTGDVRGFAVTLGLGTAISLATAVSLTQYMLHRLVDAGAQPSYWFFAPQGVPQPLEPAAAAVGAGGSAAAFGGGVLARGRTGPVASTGAPGAARSAFRPRHGAVGPDADAFAAQAAIDAEIDDAVGTSGDEAEPEAGEADAAGGAAAGGVAAAAGGAARRPGGGKRGGGRSGGSRGRGGKGSKQRRPGGRRRSG